MNGSLSLVNQSGFLKNTTTPQVGYPVVFNDAGLGNVETWWIIDKADDNLCYLINFIIVEVFCSGTLKGL